MTEPTIALGGYLHNLGVDVDGDFLRESIALLTRLLMELEVSEQIGAERYQRSEEQRTRRNGYRERSWETRVREIPPGVDKSKVSRICQELDEAVTAFRNRSLAAAYPYL